MDNNSDLYLKCYLSAPLANRVLWVLKVFVIHYYGYNVAFIGGLVLL